MTATAPEESTELRCEYEWHAHNYVAHSMMGKVQCRTHGDLIEDSVSLTVARSFWPDVRDTRDLASLVADMAEFECRFRDAYANGRATEGVLYQNAWYDACASASGRIFERAEARK